MTLADDRKIAPERITALHAECGEDLRRLALGVLHDPHLASDVVQATFVKAIEQGHTAEEPRAWLFRVALNEALAVRRRQGVRTRALDKLAWLERGANDDYDDPSEIVSRREEGERAKVALEALPAEQRQVVYMRLHEQKTFAVIAAELEVPLGTVLWRMQAALKRLRARLRPEEVAGDEE